MGPLTERSCKERLANIYPWEGTKPMLQTMLPTLAGLVSRCIIDADGLNLTKPNNTLLAHTAFAVKCFNNPELQLSHDQIWCSRQGRDIHVTRTQPGHALDMSGTCSCARPSYKFCLVSSHQICVSDLI